jgi:hypothetical protein
MAQSALSQRLQAALYYGRKRRIKRKLAQEAANPEAKAQRDAISLAYVRQQNEDKP